MGFWHARHVRPEVPSLAEGQGLLEFLFGPDPTARLAVLSTIAGLLDSTGRRILAYGRRLPIKWEGITCFTPAEPVSPPEAVREDLYRLDCVDSLLLDEIAPGHDFDTAIDAANSGKLIVTAFSGPDAVATLACLAQRSGSTAATSRGLAAVVEATMSGPGTYRAAVLEVTGPVANFVPPLLNAVKLAVDDIDANGGILKGQKLQTILGDAKGTTRPRTANLRLEGR